MPQTPLSPVTKTAGHQRTASQDPAEHIRKRVCKACDRCRLKKSKCDGSNPCSRCKADNAICVFGERKKSHDKIYPKGYVEMLEQQQSQLVGGLQEMYKRLQTASAWSSDTLPETNGHPLTHDILAALGLLESKGDGSGELETFEEDCQKLQSKLIASGAGYAHRRGSISSESEHSQLGFQRTDSYGSTPSLSKSSTEHDNLTISTSPSPSVCSPIGRTNPSFPSTQPSPLQQTSPLTADPQLYQAEWVFPGVSTVNTELLVNPAFPLQPPDLEQAGLAWDGYNFDMNAPLQPLSSSKLEQTALAGLDPMDLEFNQFIQIAT